MHEELHRDDSGEPATGIRDDDSPRARNDSDDDGGSRSGRDGGAIVGLLAERDGLLRWLLWATVLHVLAAF